MIPTCIWIIDTDVCYVKIGKNNTSLDCNHAESIMDSVALIHPCDVYEIFSIWECISCLCLCITAICWWLTTGSGNSLNTWKFQISSGNQDQVVTSFWWEMCQNHNDFALLWYIQMCMAFETLAISHKVCCLDLVLTSSEHQTDCPQYVKWFNFFPHLLFYLTSFKLFSDTEAVFTSIRQSRDLPGALSSKCPQTALDTKN